MKRDFISIPGALAVLFSLSLLFTACGGNQSTTEADANTPPPKSMVAEEPEEEEPISVSADGSTVTVNLTGDDMMKYNLDKIEVKAGQKVKINLRHIGKMNVDVMGHNFVLLQPGTDLAAFGTAAATSKDTGYIPESMKDAVIVNTDMVGGGESTSIEFDAPAAGTYKFMCSFPGHYAMMQGDFIVQ